MRVITAKNFEIFYPDSRLPLIPPQNDSSSMFCTNVPSDIRQNPAKSRKIPLDTSPILGYFPVIVIHYFFWINNLFLYFSMIL